MDAREWVGAAVSPVVRRLPHRRVTLPYLRDPSIRLSFYPDTELGMWLGWNERSVIGWWREAVTDSPTVYDVGAYVGVYSLLAADRGATVHAFEPAEDAAARIASHATANGVADSVTVNACAVGDADGAVTLHEHAHDGTRHSLVESDERDRTVTVDSTTLDTYSSTHELPDLVKVDVEGAADRVLDGAGSLRGEPGVTWLVEVHTPAERAAVAESFGDGRTRTWLDDRHVVVES